MAIAAHNVTLTLGTDKSPVEILRGVDLEVPAGASVALLGPSGSGKSSLMAVLAGLERANGGSIRVAGLDFTTMDEDELARISRHLCPKQLRGELARLRQLTDVYITHIKLGEVEAVMSEIAAQATTHRIQAPTSGCIITL